MALTKVTSRMVSGGSVNVFDFGATGDGTTDDTAAITAAAATLANGQELYFPSGTYLVSYVGTALSSVYGNKIIDFDGKSDISVVGNNAIIKVVNHNIATYGGLTFMNFKACQNVYVSGFSFDMTFTGVNTSSSYYPFCGAITAIDAPDAGQAQTAICGDFLVENCEFKLFHPFGSYAQSGTNYGGDANNGYKIFSIYASGPYLATTYATQSRNITARGCVFKDGHNAYGIWVWSWNNVLVEGCTAESFVTKQSNQLGVYSGVGTPFIRYHQFYCSGITVTSNNFRAKPCDEKLAAGFEGAGMFCDLNTNLTGDHVFGQSVVANNNIMLGNGDSAKSATDRGVTIFCYGAVTVQGNNWDGSGVTSNAFSNECITYNAEAAGGNGSGSLVVDGNNFGRQNSYSNNIVFSNGSSVAEYNRRCKELTVTNNVSLSQLQYFLDMSGNSSATHQGCRQTIISNNQIDGTFNSVFNSSSTNSRAINFISTTAADQAIISNNQVSNKYHGVLNTVALASVPNAYSNVFTGVTSNTTPGTFNALTTALLPTADNTINLGAGSLRWKNVYAGNGTIITSDGREKQQVASLSDAELRVAASLKSLIRRFKYNDAVAKKSDNARHHVGVIAQDVIGAFEAEGLDAMSYGVICFDELDTSLPAVVESLEDEIIVSELEDRYGVRYDQLFAFIIAAL